MTKAERARIWREVRELYEPRDAWRWMEAEHPQLGGRRPRDCSYDEVMAVLDRLKSGAYL